MATGITTRKAGPADLEVLARALDLKPEEVEKTFPSLTVCVCPEGATILAEGEAGTDIYVVLNGEPSVRRMRWAMFQHEVARLKSGEIFGEINFLFDEFSVPTSRSASVVAVHSCEVCRLSAEELKAHLDRRPALRARVEETARQRLYALSNAS